jgi:hypothetical protein
MPKSTERRKPPRGDSPNTPREGHHRDEFAGDPSAPKAPSPIVRPAGRLRPWLIGALFWAVLLPLSYFPRMCSNVISRYMTVVSLVERGTLTLDAMRARGIDTVDVVKFGPHFFSDKPPVLPALATVVYYPLYRSGVEMTRSAMNFVICNLALVTCVVGVCSGLTLAWLRQLLQAVPIPRWLADALTLAFGFGSLVFVYGVTFNNHSVAAALLTGSLALVLLEDPTRGRVAPRRFAAGLMAGLAATIDIPPGGLWLAGLGIWLAWRSRRIPWAFVLGAIPPLVLHCALQAKVTGSPLPVEFYPEAFQYPGSYWMKPEAQWKEVGPRWRFAIEFLVGPQGWVTVTPSLAFGFVGLAMVLLRKGDPLRPAACLVAGTVALLVAYYAWGVRRTDFAGLSFGTRHMLALSPPVFFFAVVALARLRSRVVNALFVVALMVGTAYTAAGVRNPWQRIEVLAQQDAMVRFLQRFLIYPWTSYTRYGMIREDDQPTQNQLANRRLNKPRNSAEAKMIARSAVRLAPRRASAKKAGNATDSRRIIDLTLPVDSGTRISSME